MTWPPWNPVPHLKRLLRAVVLLLPVLYGGMVHAQSFVIDVAVFYTPAVKTAQGGTAQIETKIDEMVAAANLAYTNSGVNQTINLVAAEEVIYTESTGAGAFNTDLNRLTNPSDRYLNEVHAIREQTRADIVILLRTSGDFAGLAYTMPTESTDHARWAFGVSIVESHVFIHELGHIMGLRHDRYDACKHNTGNPQCLQAVKPYAFGYVNQEAFEAGAAESKHWRTVMALDAQCSDNDPILNCRRVTLFSNPDNSYPDADGDPMGKTGTGNTTDIDGPANAARALNDTRDTVAEFRQGRAVQVSFAADAYTVTEGGAVTVTVQLDVAPGRALDIPIPLTATSTTGAWPGDYTLPASVTFSASQTEKTVTFTATQDPRPEEEETVVLGFGTPLPAGVRVNTADTAHATTTVTVTDDNDPATTAALRVHTVVFVSDPGGTYALGDEITAAVVFTKPIRVTGTPQLALTVGTITRQADCQAASEVLTCTYTVVADESDPDGVSIAADSLSLPSGATIQDKQSPPKDATLTHAAVAADSRHRVDGDTPDLESAAVDVDTVTLTYDEALDATSVPRASAFTVTAGGETLSVDTVEVSGRVVTLALGDAVRHTVSVTLAYAPPAGTPSLRDMTGNLAATLSSQTVTNNTPGPVYDTDDDGLIAITTLAQLDAIRHDLDGDGTPTAAGASAYAAAFSAATRVVCGDTSGGCAGYELMADLDFHDTNGDGQVDMDDDTNEDGQVDAEDTPYWNGGAGWEPISAPRGTRLSFSMTFEGNGHTIRHLFVDRVVVGSNTGLLDYLDSAGVIRHVGLIDVEVMGRSNVGGLLGFNDGTIIGSYVTGWVEGASSRSEHAGGLVGWNAGTITASYATAQVSGSSSVGGLVGTTVRSGDIIAGYATGRVSGERNVGGLVGNNQGGITASYATGRVSGSSSVGGLAGRSASGGTITASYWDTTTSGQTSGTRGTGQTSMELQTPTGYTAGSIYADWDVDLDGDGTDDDPWAFGTSSQYPVLRVDFDGDGTASWAEFGYQLRTGPTALMVTTDTGLVELDWTAVSTGSTWDPAPTVTYTVYRTTGSTVTAVAEDLTESAYTDRTVSRGTMYTYQVAAVVNGGEATRSASSTEVTAPNQPPTFPSTEDGMRTIAENTPANRNIGAPVAATDPDDTALTYTLGGDDADDFSIIPRTGQLQTKAALNYETKRSYEVTVTVRDGKDENNDTDDMDEDATIDVTITVTDVNEAPVVSGLTSVPDYAENSTADVATYTAMDPENRTPTWSVSDPTNFAISTRGVLTFRSPPDFERRRSYTVTVTATDPGTDPGGLSGSVRVTINITNVEEPGSVALTGAPPQMGRQLTAMLTDSDGGVSSITWTWERSATGSDPWTAFTAGVSSSGARSRYTPVAGDLNQYLRVRAAYTDPAGPNQSAQAAPAGAVQAAPVVTLILTSATVAEQDDASTPGTHEARTVVTAELDKISSAATTVTVRVTAGAAAVTQSGSRLMIAAGKTESTGTVTLTAKNDNVYEPTGSRAVSVTGSATNTDGIMGPAAVTLEITDDEEQPAVATLRLSKTEINEKEGTGNSATVTATLSHPSSAATTVDVAAVATTTGAGDFTLSTNRTLTFPPNTTTSTGTVTITADDNEVDAPNQTVRVTLTNADGITVPATLDLPLLTITDDEAAPELTLVLTPAAIDENGGVSEITATLNHESSVDIAVGISAAAVSPATGDDFALSTNKTLTVEAGDKTSTGRVTLTAEDNDLDTPDKTVTVTGAVAGYGLGTITSATKTLTITDDDTPVVTLVLTPDSISENGGQSTVTAQLSPMSSQPTVVTVVAAAVSPAVAGDFRPSTNTRLTIPANKGASEGTEVTLTAVNNDVDGPTTKKVTVSGTTREGVTALIDVTLTITDDDERGVTLAVAGQPIPSAGLSITEGATGEYTVKLDSQPTKTVTITVTSDQTAVRVQPATLTFTAGNWQTAKQVTIRTEDDPDGADLEATLTHTLTTAEGSDYEGVPVADVAVTVKDDESPSTAAELSVNPTAVGEGAGRPVTVTATLDRAVLTQDVEIEVSVAADTAADTATVGADFAAVADVTLEIEAGKPSGSATFTLTPVDDDIDEPAETLTVSGTSSDLSDGVTSTTLTLTDNDPSPTLAGLAVADAQIEEDGGTTEVTATLSNRSSEETVVGLTVPVGAEAVEVVSTLTIPAEAKSGTVTVTGVDKAGYTSHRAVTVRGRLTSPASSGQHDVRLTVLDDETPEVEGEATPTVTEGDTAVATYTAANPAGVRLVWAVSPADATTFQIDANGRLRFRAAPDHEMQASYEVTVEATDESLPAVPLTGPLSVTVTVADYRGEVRLSPTQPQVGRALTATLRDRVDGVEEVTRWCWERSHLLTFPAAETTKTCFSTDLTTTATYTPDTEDVNQHVRATATYTDGDGTTKAEPVKSEPTDTVSNRPPSRPPGGGPPGGSPGGGGGGGGGGGPACAEDEHGNSAAQATVIALDTTTAGAICPAADVDYLTVTAPGRGLIFVDSTRGIATRGTLWQDGEVLATGPPVGRGSPARLGALVQAGDVVVALRGPGGATGAYAVIVTFTPGYLENPRPDSFQSGVGVLSGWVCDADRVEMELNGVPQEAAYGTERVDTAEVCGDTDNGFGLLFNWNLLGDGDHDVVARVDGVELGRATVPVTTLGAEFVRDVAGECEVEDFPVEGERVRLVWQQSSQNFVIAEGSPPTGPNPGRTGPLSGFLENPGPNSFQSGVRVLSGWVCEADTVELAIGSAGRQVAAYGTERVDTLSACGDMDNGFGLLFNWNLLGAGEHEVIAYVDDEELGRATVRVTTLGVEFLLGVEGECLVEDFPSPGERVTVEWQQSSQNFVMTDVE